MSSKKMDTITLFGLIAVSMMLITYAMEQHSHWHLPLRAHWDQSTAFCKAPGHLD
jgi:hypothetical protein